MDRAWLCLQWLRAATLKAADGGDVLTSDDIWHYMARYYPKLSTHDPRAMGAVFEKAAAAGLIRKTERTVKSKRPECHRRDIRIWEVVG